MSRILRSRSGATRPVPIVVAVIAVALIAGACGAQSPSSSPSPSPSPVASPSVASDATTTATTQPSASPVPSPTPRPTPESDVGSRFHEQVTSPVFSADGRIDGSLSVGTVSLPITGTFAWHGADSRQTVTIKTATGDQSSGTATIGGDAYVLRGGLWYRSPVDRTSTGAGDTFAKALDVTDTGTDVRDGILVHRLVPKSGATLPSSALGAGSFPADATVAIAFYATFEGTPVLMAIAADWAQTTGAGSQRASMTMNLHFAHVGYAPAVEPPDPVWEVTISKRLGYSIAHPIDWEVSPGKKSERDMFVGPDGSGVWVASCACGTTLNSVTADYSRTIRKVDKAKIVSNTATTIDGRKARLLDYSVIYEGDRYWVLEAVVVRGKQTFFIGYLAPAPLTDADRGTFRSFLSTVDLDPSAARSSGNSAGNTDSADRPA